MRSVFQRDPSVNMKLSAFGFICFEFLFLVFSSASARSVEVNENDLQDGRDDERDRKMEAEKVDEKLLESLSVVRRNPCRHISMCLTSRSSEAAENAKELKRRFGKTESRKGKKTSGSNECRYSTSCKNPIKSNSGNVQTNVKKLYDSDDAGTLQKQRNFYDVGDAWGPQTPYYRNRAGDYGTPQKQRNFYDAGDAWDPQTPYYRNRAGDYGTPQKQRNLDDEISADEILDYLLNLAKEKKPV